MFELGQKVKGGFFTLLALLLSRVQLCKTSWTVACQVPLSMGLFSDKNTGDGCHFHTTCFFPWSLCLARVSFLQTLSIQFSSVAQSCLTLCDPMNRSTPGLPVRHQLQELTQTHVHQSEMPSSHLILCCPLLLLPPIPPSIRVFSNESTLRMRWPKYWTFSFSISPSKEYPGLISFRMDWLNLLAVQRTLKSLLQHHSSKASILWC